MKLQLHPYSNKAYNTVNKLYNFEQQCNYTLKINYKTNIACNSHFNTNKQFNSFVELTLLKDNKLIFSVYKDLTKQDDIQKEIQKGYKRLCKTIKI